MSSDASARFYRVSSVTRADVSFFTKPEYPADCVMRFARALGRRQCSVSSFDVEVGIKYHWLAVNEAPATAAELRARLSRHGAGIHFGSLIRDTQTLGPNGSVVAARIERELVFDLDLRDKLDRRALCHCGKEEACRICWLLIELAAAIFSHWLGDACGFGAPLVVFSGGKGAHIWFGNARARALTPGQWRKLGNVLRAGPPAIADSPLWAQFVDETLMPLWVARGIEARKLWDGGDARVSPFAAHVRACLGTDAAERAERAGPGGAARWAALVAREPAASVRNLVWQLAWPAVDANVENAKHLLKVPFSLHHSTLCVALPLDAAMLESCDPATMPRVPLDYARDGPLLARGRAVLETWLGAAGY